MSTKADRQERLAADRDRRRQLRSSTETQTAGDREFEARTTLARAGFRIELGRTLPLSLLEAVADVIKMWGQEAGYPDEPAGHLWPCGCLRNDAGAHRAGCPDHPEGVRG